MNYSCRKRKYEADPEQKFVVRNLVDTAFGLEWAMLDHATQDAVCIPPEGSGQTASEGRFYKMTDLRLKATVIHDGATGGAPLATIPYRVCLVLDRQTNKAQMSPTLFMPAGATNPWLTFPILNNEKRFKTLYDSGTMIYHVESMVNHEGAAYISPSHTKVCIADLHICFDPPIKVSVTDTTGARTIADIIDNSLHIVGVAALTTLKIDWRCKVRFTDY